MKGYVTKSLLFLACLFFLAMNVLAANPSSLADGAQLLKGSERIAVLNELGNIERKYGVRLAVVTVKTTNKVKIGDYANQLLDSTYTDGKNGNMVLVLAMDTRDYYVATDRSGPARPWLHIRRKWRPSSMVIPMNNMNAWSRTAKVSPSSSHRRERSSSLSANWSSMTTATCGAN